MKHLCCALLLLSACGATTGPCSVREMRSRDTTETTFESCGSVKGALTNAAVECLGEATKRKAPVELEIRGSTFGPTALLVGADFDGAYGLRLYTPTGRDSGERSAVELVLTSPDANEVQLMPDLSGRISCQGGEDVGPES